MCQRALTRSVGKTSLLNQYVTKEFSSQYKATIGADFLTKEIEVDRETVALQIWDTAGHEKFMSFGAAFYRGSDCCLLVADVTNDHSFKSLSTWKKDFLEGSGTADPMSIPFVLLLNKVDEDGSKHVVDIGAVRKWCQDNNDMPFYETSAKTGFHVDEAFLSVAERALNNILKTPVSGPSD